MRSATLIHRATWHVATVASLSIIVGCAPDIEDVLASELNQNPATSISVNPYRVVLAVIAVVAVIAAFLIFFFDNRCPKCKRMWILEATGQTEKIGLFRHREKWRCKHCGYLKEKTRSPES